MATPESLAIRRTAALDRVSAAAETIAGALGVDIAPFPDPHKRPELRPVEDAEWLAETLDAIADAVTAPSGKPVKGVKGTRPADAEPGVQIDAQGGDLPAGDIAAPKVTKSPETNEKPAKGKDA